MRLRFPLLPTVLTVVGALVLVSAGSIMALNRFTVDRTVSHLASRVVVSKLDGLEVALRTHLDEATYQSRFIADNVRSGAVRLDERDRLADFALGSMAAAPEITDLLIGGPDGIVLGVARFDEGTINKRWFTLESDSQLKRMVQKVRSRKDAFWTAPFYRATIGETLVGNVQPIWRGEDYLGFVIVALSTKQLSHFALTLSDPPKSTVFVLRRGNEVLAHMYLASSTPKASAGNPLLTTSEIVDPVLRRLDDAAPLRVAGFSPPEGIEALHVSAAGTRYLVFAKEITGLGDRPLLLGSYGVASALDHWILELRYATLIGLALIALGLAASVVASRMIARPIRDTSKGAAAIASLDFEKVAPMKGSRIKELDDLANSFNAMLVGLRSFGRYVPRALVRRLIQKQRVGAGTEERTLTVMFTDIAGFTATCEGLSPSEVADFVNHHLKLVAAPIDEEGGTIDKYIGDAVMAFWGAPDRIDDAPMRACRAAVAIQRVLAEDNEARIAKGLKPVRTRIGIHTGPLIVGDIGAPNRINYTVVGDVVNAAERLEQLGKEIDPDALSVALISRSTKDNLDDSFELIEVGHYHVKGKLEQLEVFRIVGQR